MEQFVVQPSVSEDDVCDEEDGMDLVAINSIETFGVDSRVEGLFPCRGSSVVAQKGAQDSQCIFFVLFGLARLERDLDCGGSRSNWKANVRCYSRRRTCLRLGRDVDLLPVEFVVITVGLRGIVMKVVHKPA